MLQIIRTSQEMKDYSHAVKCAGKTIGLVPTMGYLHEGHLSLIRAARAKCDVVIVTDFVNPTQFGPKEDYATYPRDEQADYDKCQSCGADILFMPSVEELYPNGQASTWVETLKLGDVLCGASRPGHFRGVTTVVTKLLWMSRADYAFFGEKDYQQLTVLRRMVQDLGCPTEIIGMPLVREADGLAMSSRNVRLSTEARQQALSLHRSLNLAKAMFAEGCRDAQRLMDVAKAEISAQPLAEIHYVALAHPDTLEILENTVPDAVMMLLAVKFGDVRLIDNMRFEA